MNNLKTYNEYLNLNEEFNAFKRKDIYNFLKKQLLKLNGNKLKELKNALSEYFDLSVEEIQEKLKSKLIVKEEVDPWWFEGNKKPKEKVEKNKNTNKEIDPYREENWVEEEEEDVPINNNDIRAKNYFAFNVLYNIFKVTWVATLISTWVFIILQFNGIDIPKSVSIPNLIIFGSSFIIYNVCKILRNRYA